MNASSAKLQASAEERCHQQEGSIAAPRRACTPNALGMPELGVAPSLPLHARYLSDVCQSPAVTVGGREIKQLDVRQRDICAWHEVKEGW